MTASGAESARDEYYGHEDVSKACAHFLTCDLGCDDRAPRPLPSSTLATTSNKPLPPPPLDVFIAHALARTQYHSYILFTALFLLARARPRPGAPAHKLLMAGFILAAKSCTDDVYSLPSWARGVARGLFSPVTLCAAELALCVQLRWNLHIPREELVAFEQRVRRPAPAGVPWPFAIGASTARALIRRARLAKKARARAASSAERAREYAEPTVCRIRAPTMIIGPTPRAVHADLNFAHHLKHLEELVADKQDKDERLMNSLTTYSNGTMLTPPDSPTPTPTPRADRWLTQQHYACKPVQS